MHPYFIFFSVFLAIFSFFLYFQSLTRLHIGRMQEVHYFFASSNIDPAATSTLNFLFYGFSATCTHVIVTKSHLFISSIASTFGILLVALVSTKSLVYQFFRRGYFLTSRSLPPNKKRGEISHLCRAFLSFCAPPFSLIDYLHLCYLFPAPSPARLPTTLRSETFDILLLTRSTQPASSSTGKARQVSKK